MLPCEEALSYRGGVKLSVKSDYAARAMLELARRHTTGKAQRVETLAEAQGVPANYLVQILIELNAQRLVKSVRGKVGGYLLAKAPVEITLGEVLRCVHGEIFDTSALTDGNCPPELRGAWEKLRRTVNLTADAITFQDLLDEGTGKEKMYYI